MNKTDLILRSMVMVGWGIAGGTAAFFLAERIPPLRRDLYSRLPFLGDRWAAYRRVEEEAEAEE